MRVESRIKTREQLKDIIEAKNNYNFSQINHFILSVKKEAKVPEHRSRLFIDETSDVVSASNDDPVYNLRKEIRNWRESGQLNEFERERFIIEDGTKKNVLQGKV